MPTAQPAPTVNFTKAEPLLPAINGGGLMMRSMMRSAGVNNGVELAKTATANRDGSYATRLEAYVTRKTTLEITVEPVDIVLVLDQSGSMIRDFGGYLTTNYVASRQYALKQAVKAFIESVAEKYSASADHREACAMSVTP